MGLSGISPLSLLLILLIIVVLFGTERLKNIGTDLGNAIKNFRRAMDDSDIITNPENTKLNPTQPNSSIDNKSSVDKES